MMEYILAPSILEFLRPFLCVIYTSDFIKLDIFDFVSVS